MKIQATIENVISSDNTHFMISIEEDGELKQLPQEFTSYADCLAFISEQDWQVKREAPSSLLIPTQFMKP